MSLFQKSNNFFSREDAGTSLNDMIIHSYYLEVSNIIFLKLLYQKKKLQNFDFFKDEIV